MMNECQLFKVAKSWHKAIMETTRTFNDHRQTNPKSDTYAIWFLFSKHILKALRRNVWQLCIKVHVVFRYK